MRGTRGLIGALLITGLATATNWCAAAGGPDSLATEVLRHRLEYRSLARVTGPWGAARLTDPRIGTAGLEFLAAWPDEPAAETAAAVPKPIPLDQVLRVEIQANNAGVMALAGGLIGALIGYTTTQELSQIMGPNPSPSGGEMLTGALIGAMPGAILGALLGAPFRHWKTIYPKDQPPPLTEP